MEAKKLTKFQNVLSNQSSSLQKVLASTWLEKARSRCRLSLLENPLRAIGVEQLYVVTAA